MASTGTTTTATRSGRVAVVPGKVRLYQDSYVVSPDELPESRHAMAFGVACRRCLVPACNRVGRVGATASGPSCGIARRWSKFRRST